MNVRGKPMMERRERRIRPSHAGIVTTPRFLLLSRHRREVPGRQEMHLAVIRSAYDAIAFGGDSAR